MKKQKWLATALATLLVASMTTTSVPATVLSADNTSVSQNDITAPVIEVSETETPAETATNETTINVSAASGTDITTALQAALDQARDNNNISAVSDAITVVKVPAGSYTLSNTLSIYSNTTLDLTAGVTLTSVAESIHMLMIGPSENEHAYNKSEAVAGYGGYKNITINGGSFVAPASNTFTQMRLAHATNVTLNGVTIAGGTNDHMVEAAAIDGFYVSGCTFRDMAASTKVATREALQLDLAVADSIYPNIYQDGTMMKNVTIQNCTFKNVSRGIGSHSMLLGADNTNIKILNNTFQNVEQDCIVTLNYVNCEISGNVMTGCGSGILVQSCKASPTTIYTTVQNGAQKYSGNFTSNVNTIIKNNTITTRYNSWNDTIFGIKLYGRNITSAEYNSNDGGTVPAGDYYLSGVQVLNNTITTAGYGIHMADAKNCILSGNKITGSGYDTTNDALAKSASYSGIHIAAGSTGNKVTGNTVSSVQCNGIYLANSSATEVTSNIINNPAKDGINIAEGIGATGNIADNSVTNAGEHGIVIHGKTTVGSVKSNTVNTAKGNGIHISDRSTATDVTSNTVQKTTGHGISLLDSSTGTITGNKVTSAGASGIQLKGSKAGGSITSNSVTSSTDNGICLYDSASVTGNISGNKISKSKSNGIALGSSSKVIGNITGNSISSSDNNGIGVTNGASMQGNIETNTITSSDKTGIQVSDKASMNGNIYKNTITTSGVNGINISTSTKITGNIKENSITDSKKTGINLFDSSVLTGNIDTNKIKNSDNNGICVSDSSTLNGDIIGNTITSSDKTGIQVASKSTVSGSIKSNTAKTNGLNGISVISSSSVGKDIASNTITSNKKNGLNLDKATIGGSIKGNKISTSTYNGIGITNKSKVKGNIEKNKVDASKKTGIQVDKKSVVSKQIKSNTVTNSTANGICVLGASTVKKGIVSNTVKKAKKFGIYFVDKAVIGGNVEGNKITSCNTAIVTSKDSSVAIRINTLSKNKNNYSRIVSTSLLVKSVSKPTLKSVSKKGNTINVKWNKAKKANGYLVEISTTKDFSKIYKSYSTSSTSAAIKKVAKGKTYYVRVSAYRGAGKARIYSGYSKVKKIKL
ncbi:MAG: hypothetical protein E7289_01645 [Lachnospiraceae bacterium]|nr:hypothetical protein [Lachnospiraceae bacterium]